MRTTLGGRRGAIRVRPIQRRDLDTWCRMRRALWPDAGDRDLIQDAEAFLGGKGSLQVVFVGETPSGEPLGVLELSLRSYAEGCGASPVPHVEAWYVMPEARRRGVGRALVAAAQVWARERGHTEIASDATITNIVGERAHLALGFDEVERAIHFRKSLHLPTS